MIKECTFAAIERDAVLENLTDDDVYFAWCMGVKAFKEAKDMGAKFPDLTPKAKTEKA